MPNSHFSTNLHFEPTDRIRVATFPELSDIKQDWISFAIGDLKIFVEADQFAFFELAMQQELRKARTFFAERKAAADAVAAFKADCEQDEATESELSEAVAA